MKETNTRELMAQTKFYDSYSRWDEELGRYETWEESVSRVMNMHRQHYSDKMTPELSQMIDEAENLYKLKYALGSQRALQYGGEQLLKHQLRMFNCTSHYADRPEFFNESFYILLTGAGMGFSVQKHHVAKLPKISDRKKQAKIHVVEDSIEGWADALGVLMSSFFVGGGAFPEYEGRRVYFDLSKIRPKGSHISGGFKAPGPEPLRRALDKVEHLIQGLILRGVDTLSPIHVYDITLFAADAVLSGGVRRSATICLFSFDDEEMANAKTGNWFIENPQRGRSNNSAVILRSELTRESFRNLMKKIKEFGEPGFFFVDDLEHATNPCVEIGMFPQYNGISGVQGCNLSEINGSKATTPEEFYRACRAAAILGTLQAGYTNFKYISEVSKKIFEREALLGVSVTGWLNNPQVLLDEEVMREGAKIVKRINKKVARLIGINQAARTTCTKPSGSTSVILQTASGIHGENSPRYLRNVQMTKDSDIAELIAQSNPYMVEESVWSESKNDLVISFPIIADTNSIFKKDVKGVKLLEIVKKVQENWVEYGTNEHLCASKGLRHNVSNTITVPDDEWDEVEEYVFENRHAFAGISFLADTGDKDYEQAPFTEVLTPEQIVEKYGDGALFASGLIVDSTKGFNGLWDAIRVAKTNNTQGGELNDMRAEWIRRFKKFADNYFGGNIQKAEYCLKDVHLLHKWTKIQQNYQPVDFVNGLTEVRYTDIDQMGAVACSGGACEVSF